MKYTFVVLWVAFSFFNQVKAQFFVQHPDSVIVFEGVDLTVGNELQIFNYIGNKSFDTIRVRWQFEKSNDCDNDWDFYKIDEFMTYFPGITSNVEPTIFLDNPVVLPPDELSSPMVVYLFPDDKAGCCEIGFEFYDYSDSTFLGTIDYEVYVNPPTTNCEVSNNANDSIVEPIQVSPNPTSGTLFVKSESPISSVEVFSLHGQSFEEMSEVNYNEIDLGHLPPGLYYLKIEMENGGIGWAKVSRM